MRRTAAHIEEELLVLRCQDAEPEAWRRLIGLWRPRAYRHALRLTGDADGASDVAQESCLALVRGIGRLSDPAMFRGWAHRIVRNKAADWVRARARERAGRARATGPGADRPGPAEAAAGADDAARLRRAVAALPAALRETVELYYAEGLGVREVAAVLGVAPGTVKSRLHGARGRLRAALEGAPEPAKEGVAR